MAIDPTKAVERLEKQYKRQNEHIKENYKRLSVTIRNDTFEQIRLVYGDDLKMNGYINNLILSDLQAHQEQPTQPSSDSLEDKPNPVHEIEDMEKLQEYLEQLRKDNEQRKQVEKAVDKSKIENVLEE